MDLWRGGLRTCSKLTAAGSWHTPIGLITMSKPFDYVECMAFEVHALAHAVTDDARDALKEMHVRLQLAGHQALSACPQYLARLYESLSLYADWQQDDLKLLRRKWSGDRRLLLYVPEFTPQCQLVWPSTSLAIPLPTDSWGLFFTPAFISIRRPSWEECCRDVAAQNPLVPHVVVREPESRYLRPDFTSWICMDRVHAREATNRPCYWIYLPPPVFLVPSKVRADENQSYWFTPVSSYFPCDNAQNHVEQTASNHRSG